MNFKMMVEFNNTRSPKSTAIHGHKIVVIGPRKVGKSALVVRFFTKRYINEYIENTEMEINREADVDGESFPVHIVDTSDSGMRYSYMEQQLKNAGAIMMVYSIADREGFRQLKNFATRMLEKALDMEEKELNRFPPMVLVGNKGDLKFLRKVPKRDGYELADQLHCDFFEVSAREGWSKLIKKSASPISACSPSSDIDSISLLAGTAGNMGVVGLPSKEMSREMMRCMTPTLTRRRSPITTSHSDNERCSEMTPVRRWGSFNSLNRLGDGSGSGKSGNQSFAPSPTASDDEIDDKKLSRSQLYPGDRKNQTNLIRKLSPRLARKFCKTSPRPNDAPEQKQILKSDKNNNNNNSFRSKTSPRVLSLGLSSTLLASAKLGEALCAPVECNRLSNHNASSHESSACTSTSGSLESLSKEMRNSAHLASRTPPNHAPASPSRRTPILVKTSVSVPLEEHDFSSAEPFLRLCRDKVTRSRVRSRSPTHMIMNSFKKIRSLTDHSGSGNSVNRNKSISSSHQNLLTVPGFNF